MKVFTSFQKMIARNNSPETLKSARDLSVDRLADAATYGDSRNLKAALKEYLTYDRALLYQITPAYRQKILIKGGCRL